MRCRWSLWVWLIRVHTRQLLKDGSTVFIMLDEAATVSHMITLITPCTLHEWRSRNGQLCDYFNYYMDVVWMETPSTPVCRILSCQYISKGLMSVCVFPSNRHAVMNIQMHFSDGNYAFNINHNPFQHNHVMVMRAHIHHFQSNSSSPPDISIFAIIFIIFIA